MSFRLMTPVLAFMILGQPQPALAEAVAVELPGEGRASLAWVLGEEVHTTLLTLPAKLDLPAGEGCMVLARAGVPVRWLELSLPDDLARLEELLDAPHGTLVEGTVSTHDLTAFPPAVRIAPFQNQPPAECRLGIEELGVWRAQVDGRGRFELGPVTPGWWRVSVSARLHASADRVISIDPTINPMKLGRLEARPVTSVIVEVDTERVAPPFNLRVEQRLQRPQDGRSVAEVANHRIDTPSRALSLRPGWHRFHLTRPGTDLGLSVDEEVGIGEHHLVLRPRPFSVAGRVLREGGGVAGVELTVEQRGRGWTLTSGSRGEFHLDLWIPAFYRISTRTPEGEIESFMLDLREAQAGEELTRDLELAEEFVSGSVMDAATGAPLADAEVVVRQHGGGRAYTNSYPVSEDGRFRLPLKSGMAVRLEARSSGYMRRAENLGTERPSTHLTLALERGREVSGRLVGPRGDPLPGTVMGMMSGAISPWACIERAGPDGHFSLTCPTGAMLFALSPGYSLGWVPAGEGELVLSLGVLQPATVLQIRSPDGSPAVGGIVTVQTAEGLDVLDSAFATALSYERQRSRTDAEGTISVSILPPGTYRFFIWWRYGEQIPLGTATLPSPTPVTRTLPDPPPG